MISLLFSAIAGAASAQPAVPVAATDGMDGPPSPNAWARVEMTRDELTHWLGPVDSVDYGRFQWLPAATLQQHSISGAEPATVSPPVMIDHPFLLHLGGEWFDPATRALTPDEVRGIEQDHRSWWLVQFIGPTMPHWLRQLTDIDLQPVQYLHPYTYAVWGRGSAIDALHAASPDHVRAISRFRDTYKLPPTLPPDGGGNGEQHMLMVLIANDEIDQIDTIRGGATLMSLARINDFLSLIYMAATGVRVPDLTALPGVYAVQDIPTDAGIRGEIQNQVNVGNVDADGRAHPGYLGWLEATGYRGSGVITSIVDELGFRHDHADLVDRSTPCVAADIGNSSCSGVLSGDHATHVAGAVAGTGASQALDGDGFLRGLGVAPGARIVSQDFLPMLGQGHGGLTAHGMLTIFQEAALSGAVVANNSWGPSTQPRGYDIPTQQVDMIVRNADPAADTPRPLLPVWAVMNGRGDGDGACAPSSLGSPDEAKNLFAVGATYLIDDAGQQVPDRMNDLAWVSGHGNACDGRRVPHIVAPGCNTDNAVADGGLGHSHGGIGSPGFSQVLPGWCGTSMAAPNVAGAAALFIERHRHQFGADPSPALIKAAVSVVATDLAGHHNANHQTMGHRPDRFQGFGRLDLDAAVNPPARVVYVDQDHVLTESGAQWLRRVSVDDPSEPVRIMLAWTDAPGHGLGGETPAWVNDLDLDVLVGDTLYRGNVVGADGWSSGGGAPDARNNMEAVFLSPAQHGGGDIDLRILAGNIAADALDPYSDDLTSPRQDFALVCYNCVDGPMPAATGSDLVLVSKGPTRSLGPGDTADFIVHIDNAGPDPVHDLTVTFQLPAEFSHVKTTGGASSAWNCTGAGEVVRCRRDGALASGDSTAALGFTARVAADVVATQTVTTTIGVDARNNVDPQPANDRRKWSTVIDPSALAVEIFADGFERTH